MKLASAPVRVITIDGGWSPWSTVSTPCMRPNSLGVMVNVTCGGGTMLQRRSCTNPIPQVKTHTWFWVHPHCRKNWTQYSQNGWCKHCKYISHQWLRLQRNSVFSKASWRNVILMLQRFYFSTTVYNTDQRSSVITNSSEPAIFVRYNPGLLNPG